jgi:hypothetical protein
MQTTPSQSLVEAYLLIEQPRQRLGHWSNVLAALDSPLAPTLSSVVALYDATNDQALINLQYADLDELQLSYVVNVAVLAEVGMVQPAALSEGERARFVSTRLARCTLRVTAETTAVGALTALVKKLKDERAVKSGPARTVLPRGDTADPVMLVNPKGTRDNLEKLARDAENGAPPPPRRDHDPGTSRHVIARIDRHVTVEISPIVAKKLAADAVVAVSAGDITSPMPLGKVQELSSEMRQSEMIYARYLRGGKWIAVRVGALSLKGAALMTGALPRLHDRTDIALRFGKNQALVCGVVAKVSSARETSTTGTATFSVAFDLDDTARKQLRALLVAARDAKITIKPPPPRAARRFPVEWQVALGTTNGFVRATLLDVSTGGMFVRPEVPLELGTSPGFSVVLDDGGTPIAGRVRVVRDISESEARACGLTAGFGLSIFEIAEADRMRWLGFLARIERRAEKRVLIGAEPERLAELQAGLAGLGYAVIGGTDTGTLIQLANSDRRPCDAVLLDAGWLQADSAVALVESLFSSRKVPCVTMNGEVRRARQTIDRLLEVVV